MRVRVSAESERQEGGAMWADVRFAGWTVWSRRAAAVQVVTVCSTWVAVAVPAAAHGHPMLSMQDSRPHLIDAHAHAHPTTLPSTHRAPRPSTPPRHTHTHTQHVGPDGQPRAQLRAVLRHGELPLRAPMTS